MGRLLAVLVSVLCAAIVAGVWNGSPATGRPAASSGTAAGPSAIRVPAGVTAGVAVFDRQTGTFSEQLDANRRFRSASVVKLLIALDYLWNRGPTYAIPAVDRPAFDRMLRGSDDAAAGDLWTRAGYGAVVERMVTRLHLVDTAPPDDPNFWGYTALSAADVVRIYRYLLDTAPAPVRDAVMGDLRQSTRCAVDSFDQHFGIPSAFDRPWAVKQGWSGFDSGGCGPTATAPSAAPAGVATTAGGIDLTSPALHTTGTVGAGDRSIVAVLTLHPAGTSYGKAYTDVGRLTRSLNVPGAVRPTGSRFGTWSTGVHVRNGSNTGSSVVTTLPAGVEVLVDCQVEGEEITVPPYTNQWWAHLPQYGGYMTNIYVGSPDKRLPDVPLCP
ncbi:hypothetical protein [Embleya sp. MST-111070]|uniref:hypothetical protein n=1 Tax=Embleya sp. MST-111070 TaxID=3398231 RepID=UPI003F73600F